MSTLAAAGGDRGWRIDAEGAAGGHIVPVSNGLDDGEVARALTASPQGHRHDPTATTYVTQPNEEVGALTASGGPSALDDQSTSQLVVGRETGHGWWDEGEEAATLTARGHKDHGGTVVADDPARPVAVRGRDGGAQAELGDEPIANALRAGDGGSSRSNTILAYEVDKERGVPNDEGVKVTETDVAPPLLADGDPAERTDRGLRVVQPIQDGGASVAAYAWGISSDAIDRTGEGAGGSAAERSGLGVVEELSPTLRAQHAQGVAAVFRKQRRAATSDDDETWVEGEVANTLNNFDGGDTRATEVVVEALGFTEGGTGQAVDDVAGTLQASQPGEDSARQNVVAAFSIGQDALRGGAGVARTPSADAEGRVRLRDPGLGVYDDGEPAATVTATGPGAVGLHITQDSIHLDEGVPALGAKSTGQGVGSAAEVRRLTPLECERLQGLDDGWTDVDGASDSTRYRQLGNAVCAAVSSWLGWRVRAYVDGWRP